jgi:hypothetical protein
MKFPTLLALLGVMASLTACQSGKTSKTEPVAQVRPAAETPVATPKPVTPLPSEPTLEHWIADASTGCKVSNPKPEPNESIRWKGKCKNGLAEGKGTLEWFKGGQPYSVSTGNFREGKLHGHVIYHSANGGFYEGETVNDKKDGHGIVRWVNGDSYEGEFVNDSRTGHGTYRYADGRIESGIWRNDDCPDCSVKPAPSPAAIVAQLCEQLSTGASIDGLRCENAAKNVAEDTSVAAIQAHCQSYGSPGKKLACFETGTTLLAPRDAQQIAKYEDSCLGKKGKIKTDCYSEVYAQVGIKQSSEQAQAAQAAAQQQQAENYAAQQRQEQESQAAQRDAYAANCRKRCSDNYTNCVSSTVASTLSNQIMALATGAGNATQGMALNGQLGNLTCLQNQSTCESNCP